MRLFPVSRGDDPARWKRPTMTHEDLLFIKTSIAPNHRHGGSLDSLVHRLPGSQSMITHRFISLRPIRPSAACGRLRVRTGRCGCARPIEPDLARAEPRRLPGVDDAAWGWRQLGCFLVVLLVTASITYIYAQEAAAFLQTFNQPVSLGSDWEALASRNGPIPTLPLNWQFP